MSTFESPCVTGLLLSTTWVRRRLFEELTQCPQVSSHTMKDTRLCAQTQTSILKIVLSSNNLDPSLVSFLKALRPFPVCGFMLCAKTKVKYILNVKNRWQKTSGLRKVANMFQSFFTFSLLALFSLPWPPCCLSISSCSSPPQIVLFNILLYFLNPLSAYAHCSSHSISNIHHNCKLYRSSWQCSSWIKSPNITIKELMFNIFSHFRLIFKSSC